MKKILLIVIFLICGIVSAQNPAYFFNGRVDVPRTTAQILATVSPVEGLAFMSSDTDTLWRYQGGVWVDTGIGGGGTWGSITGILSDQTDLQSALDSKLGSGDNVSELVNDAGYITDSDVGGIVAEGLQALTPNSTNTINHGLGYAPDASRIGITFFKDSAAASGSGSTINNITSTSFDITIGSETGLSAAWRIFGTDTSTPISGSEIVSSIDTELGSTDWQDGGGGTDDQTASEVNISDTGNNYTGTTVEAALAEVADSLAAKVNINPNSAFVEVFRGSYAAAQAEYGVDPNTWPESLFAIIPDYPSTPIPLSSITYDNSTSGMTADDGQEAIDELEARVDINDAKVSNANHTGDVTGSTTLTITTGAVGPDELESTAVTPGSYTNADITVDADGRVTAASNGSGGGASQLSDLSDVNTSTPTNRNVLVADGTDWESRALEEADISDLGSYILTSNLLDDDTFAAASSTTVPSSESVKAYVDANAGGVDTNDDLYLSSATATGHELGTQWLFSGNPYSIYFSGQNGSAYLNVNLNGTQRSMIFGTTSFRPLTDAQLALGSVSQRFTTAWFSGNVTAAGYAVTGANNSQFVKAGGGLDSNTYLTAPSVSQLGTNFSTTLAHANGTVNYITGGDLTYTLEPNSTVAHLVGTRILINNENTGGTGLTITAGTGVTLVGGDPVLATGEAAWVVQVTTDEWLIIPIN